VRYIRAFSAPGVFHLRQRKAARIGTDEPPHAAARLEYAKHFNVSVNLDEAK
jgi:hypothetical protein